MHMGTIADTRRRGLGGEGGTEAFAARSFANDFTRDDGMVGSGDTDCWLARDLILADAIFRFDGFEPDLGGKECA
jgi:hypothetical protein